MSGASTPLGRLIPKRTWTDAHGRGLLVWGGLFALGVVLSVILLTLLVDLLSTRGVLTTADLSRLDQGGYRHLEQLQELAAGRDVGLWAQAVRYGNLPGWRWLPGVLHQFPQLKTSRQALLALVVMGLLLAWSLMLMRSRARSHAHETAKEISTRLRKAIHRQTLRLGPSDLTGQRHQNAFKLFTDTVDEVRSGLTQYRWSLTRAATLVPLMLFTLLSIDWRLGLQCLIPAAACWLVYRYERERGATQRQLAEAHAETESRFLADGLRQTRLVRGYNIENFEANLFESHLSRLTAESQMGRQLESSALRLARLVVATSIAIVLVLIGLRLLSSQDPLTIANGTALALVLGVLIQEAASLERMVAVARKLVRGSEQIYRYLDEIPEVGQAVGAKFIQPVSSSIVYEAVHYQQRGHEVLRGIDLRIEANTQVALVSLDPLLPKAVAYMLPRFIEPSKGRVLFDGEDIAWGTLESIHAETLYVGGDDPVLSGTVLENLICGDERLSTQDAIEAAKMVHVNKFLSGLPLGYQTVLGEHGTTIGIGEAFQLGLARAILRNPAVLIIQEPDLILDEELKIAIDDAYQRIAQKRTVIFLPSRLSTIRRCDQVVLLHDGKVEGLGPHQDLRKASELYRHWDYITFNTFSRETRRLQTLAGTNGLRE